MLSGNNSFTVLSHVLKFFVYLFAETAKRRQKNHSAHRTDLLEETGHSLDLNPASKCMYYHRYRYVVCIVTAAISTLLLVLLLATVHTALLQHPTNTT